MVEGALLCAHIVPHAAFAGVFDLDVTAVAQRQNELEPIYSSGVSHTYNIDGLLTYSPVDRDGTSAAYLQVFRNGVVESVNSSMLQPGEARPGHPAIVPSTALARELHEFLPRVMAAMSNLGIVPPVSAFVSLLGVKGMVLAVDERMMLRRNPRAYDRDYLLFRELVFTEWPTDAVTATRPLLNELWQAAGLQRCLDYDEHGNWRR
jgi:hypothetical protein